MTMRLIYFLIAIIAFSQKSVEAIEEDLIVRLETEAKLLPIYLSKWQSDKSIDSVQEKALNDILRFDLSFGGYSTLIESKPDWEKIAERTVSEGKVKIDTYFPASYILVPKLQGKALTLFVYSTSSGTTKGIGPLELYGDIKKDRTLIHLFSDQIHQHLFGTEGISRQKILYTVKRKTVGKQDWTSDLWEMDYDGGNAHQILKEAGYVITPQYIPAGKGKRPGSYLYVSYQSGVPKIFIGRLDGSKPSRLTLVRGNQLMPAMNRQKTRIAFISDAAGNPDLFLLLFSPEDGPIGKPIQLFSAKMGVQGTPTFSPSGNEIAFVSNKDGSPRIYKANLQQEGERITVSEPELLTKFRRGATAPSWSPDGKKIAYCAPIDHVHQIFVYDLKKRQEEQITSGPGDKQNPTWAPNSLHVIFNSSVEGSCEIFLTNINQKKMVQVSKGEGEKRFPHFEPLYHP
jgi:TolB protein